MKAQSPDDTRPSPLAIAEEDRGLCSDEALYCFGTAYIFEKRAARTRRLVRGLTFLGIVVPVAMGAVYTTFRLGTNILQVIVTIAGVLGLLQLVASVWSLVAGWNDQLAAYLESKAANYRLAESYGRLARCTTVSDTEFKLRLASLTAENGLRKELDLRVDLNEKEKRMGLRAGLRRFQRACVECRKIPRSMKPTKCRTCGG